MILLFELTMPNRGSWDGHWSGEHDGHYIIKASTRKVDIERYKVLDGKDFYHRRDDGWTACISCRVIDSKEAAKLRKHNAGFCGYDWMVSSILRGAVDEHSGRMIHEG